MMMKVHGDTNSPSVNVSGGLTNRQGIRVQPSLEVEVSTATADSSSGERSLDVSNTKHTLRKNNQACPGLPSTIELYCCDCGMQFGSISEHDDHCDTCFSYDETDTECDESVHSQLSTLNDCLPTEYEVRCHAGSRLNGKLRPQFGLESIPAASFAVDALARFAKIDIPDKVLREIEGVILLIVNLTQQTTPLGVITSVLTWAQGRCSESLFKTLRSYIEEILVSPQSSEDPAWLDCLRDLRQNWHLCRNNSAFKQISKLMGCLVLLGMCDVSDLTFSLGQFKVIWPALMDKHTNAFDVADALFETVIFFVEGAYLCFKTGSLKPFLVNDRTVMELDAEYAQVAAWFDLVRNGNLKKFADMSDHEFEGRLNRLSTSLKNLSQSLTGIDKKLVLDKFQKVLVMQNDFVTMKLASGVRHSPWAVEFFGDSSQGKTTISDQMLDIVMTSANLPTDKTYRCTYNPGDRFMSNWKSDKLVLTFDDVSNEKSQFVEKPPTRAIIDVINNQMYYAPKAELESKGKCFVEPWIVTATTNKKDLDAGCYSNCPYSIQRRFKVVTVRAKKQFQKVVDGIYCGIDTTKVREFYTNSNGVYEPPMFDDIWLVDVEVAVKPQKLSTVATYKPIEWNGRVMKNVPMSVFLQWAIEDFALHRADQEAILAGQKNRARNIKVCGVDGCCQIVGNCPSHDPMRPHFGKETLAAIQKLWWSKDPGSIFDAAAERADREIAEKLYTVGMKFLDEWNWVRLIPAPALQHPYFEKAIRWYCKDDFEAEFQRACRRTKRTAMLCSFAAFLLLPLWLAIPTICIIVCIYLSGMKHMMNTIEDELFEELRKRNLSVGPIFQRVRDQYATAICTVSIAVAALYGLSRAYKAYKINEQKAQGSLEPKTFDDIKQRDNETNVWTSIVQRDLPITEVSRHMTCSQLNNIVAKALVYGTIHRSDGNGMVNGLMLSSNAILIPDHYFHEFGSDLDCTFRKKNPEATGGKFAARLHLKYSVLLENSDLRVCYIPNGGSFKNLVNFFPTAEMPSVPFQMQWRKKDGTIIHARGITQPQIVQTWKPFVGGRYKNLTIDTFDGLCGATLTSDTNGSVIIGVHLGGTAGTPVGVYGSITQQKLFAAFETLRKMEGVLLTGSAGKFEPVVLDVQVLKKDPLHKKSALNYLPENSQIEYYGSCIGRSVNKSDVRVTPISEHVTDVCNVPNIYRGPKFNPDWFGWQTCLANLAVPALPFSHHLLEIAIRDYKEPLLVIFASTLWRTTCPLLDHENLCGIPGMKFLDAIKLNTSVGFPLTGPKREYITELEPTEDRPNNRELDPKLMDEIKRIEDCYRRGERGYPIAKACKKDEILTKEKCRIFYGNALSLTYLIRKYYLPLLRVLQMNPLVSECAVGINSHGPEWEQFHQHVTKFGMDRLIGGDYGKYDQKLPAQLIIAALRILIDCARECAYTEEDIRVMEAMVGDIVYAYIAFNGDLIGLTEGTHISGNSLTVIINGICGSLNLRCYFYSQYPVKDFEDRLVFRDCVAAMTYGDDNIGSVSSDIDKFTIKGCSKFLDEYGQVYTMPDKESELLDFLPEEEFEFLKRKSVYHPRLGVHVGALLDKSIYKSLHCFMRGKNCPLTEEHACAINIDAALTEWFNHGEEKYESQRLKMKEVATRANIKHMCTGLELSYADRCADWVAKYGDGSALVTPKT